MLQLFKLLSTVLPIRTESKVGPWSSYGQRVLPWADLWKQKSGSPAEQELRRRIWYRATLQKSHILGKWILSDQCTIFFFSKRLRNTAACCYETYRVQREGRGESWESFTCCRLLLWHFNDTQTHRPCKSGWDIILQLSRHDSPGMSSLLCFSGRGYLWGQTPCSFVSTLLTLFRKKEI